ncbi:unnamed protein product, partial [Cladocopium goreaui]
MVSRELARLRASCVWNPPSKCHSQHQLGLHRAGRALDRKKESLDAKPFLDEARDYLESPHLLHVFRSVSNVTAERLPQELAKTGGKASALKEGTVPLATLFGGCITLGKNLFQ